MRKKKMILLVISLMTVAFAAVTTALYIGGQTNINANKTEYDVYFSDVYVNGVQDLSVVDSKTVLSFTTTLDKLGSTYVLDYDVTNGSRNYDAEVTMTCTSGNDYLSVSNDFNDVNILKSLETRKGKLTLEQTKSYVGDSDLNITIECTIDTVAIERDSLGEGEAADPVEPLGE